MSNALSLVMLPVDYSTKSQSQSISIEKQVARNSTKVFEAYVKARREKRRGGK